MTDKDETKRIERPHDDAADLNRWSMHVMVKGNKETAIAVHAEVEKLLDSLDSETLSIDAPKASIF